MSSKSEEELRQWLDGLGIDDPTTEDDAVEHAIRDRFQLDEADGRAPSPDGDLIGFHASGTRAIARALRAVPVTAADTFIDLGAGNGKVVLLARIRTGARVRGIELRRELVANATSAARRLGVDVELVHGDARTAPIDDGTVFYLYAPFVGRALDVVLDRLASLSRARSFVVCAVGLELDAPRRAPWLVRQAPHVETDLWLELYRAGPGEPGRR